MEKGVEVWLARDLDGELHGFICKPELVKLSRFGESAYWVGSIIHKGLLCFEDNSFPEVTFKNSPVKARIVILEDE
jgi:hypothetical protein